MALENINRIIKKADHWPALKDRRAYLIAALACEKGAHRRRVMSTALRNLTTRVLKQELRGRA